MERAISLFSLKLSNHIVKTSFSKFPIDINTYRLIFSILGSLYFSAHQKMKIQYALIHFLFSHPSNSSVSFSFFLSYFLQFSHFRIRFLLTSQSSSDTCFQARDILYFSVDFDMFCLSVCHLFIFFQDKNLTLSNCLIKFCMKKEL